MYNSKITQISRNNHLNFIKIFLKFCYFSFLLFFLACKTDDQQKPKKDTDNTANEFQNNSESTQRKRIIIFGDSLTAGYGLEDVNDAFPGILQTKIDSLGMDYIVINSGVSGETTAGGKNRIAWVLNEKPAIFILELGGNDGLRGVPLSETKSNLQFIIDTVRKKYPQTKIIIAGMQIPPNLGQDYTNEFKRIFPNLAEKNNISLIPFLLDGVGGNAELNQSDGIHPNEKGHKILADNVWKTLRPLLE